MERPHWNNPFGGGDDDDDDGGDDGGDEDDDDNDNDVDVTVAKLSLYIIFEQMYSSTNKHK